MSAPAGKIAPMPEGTWPTDTYFDEFHKLPAYFNGEAVILYHAPAANTDGDSTVDYVVQTLRLGDLGPAAPTLDMILFEVVTIDDAGAPIFDTDLYFANGVDGSVDTNTFDTNVITLPVPVTELGMDAPRR